MLTKLTLTVAAFYLLLIVILMLLETKLVYPAPRGKDDRQRDEVGAQDVWCTTADGARLHGWLIETDQPQHFILFFHGNGECVPSAGPELKWLSTQLQATIMVIDYRGYGQSTGSPSEKGLLHDGAAALKRFQELTGQRSENIVVIGRSLGGGVACRLAADHQLRGLILISTFSRMVDVAAWHYPLFPVRWIMRNRFDSQAALAQYRGPLLQFHGERDRVVPLHFGRALHQACPSTEKTFHLFPQADHDLHWDLPRLRAFLDGRN